MGETPKYIPPEYLGSRDSTVDGTPLGHQAPASSEPPSDDEEDSSDDEETSS